MLGDLKIEGAVIYLFFVILLKFMNSRFCGNGVPDWVPQPPTFNFPYPLEVEYEVDDEGYPSRQLKCKLISNNP